MWVTNTIISFDEDSIACVVYQDRYILIVEREKVDSHLIEVAMYDTNTDSQFTLPDLPMDTKQDPNDLL